MTNPLDTSAEARGERLARLEANLENLDRKVEERHIENTKKLDKMGTQMSEILELIAGARGAKYAIIGLAGLVGYAATWLHKIPIWPKG